MKKTTSSPPAARISEAEREVLGVLWKKSPLTAAEVFETLSMDKTWKLTTVRTFLTRLEKKGIIAAREGAEARTFHPKMSQEACVRQESETFLKRVFNGRAAALLMHFAMSERLSETEIAQLQSILAKNGSAGKRRRGDYVGQQQHVYFLARADLRDRANSGF